VLGGHFQEKEDHGISLREMQLLGMAIRFVPWRGIGLKAVYQLSGYTEAPDEYEADQQINAIDLSAALVYLLHSNGAGLWRIPTVEEMRAEASTEVSRAMHGSDSEPPDDWPVDG
jgi:hypothetical protein